jgi:hypothetical protein
MTLEDFIETLEKRLNTYYPYQLGLVDAIVIKSNENILIRCYCEIHRKSRASRKTGPHALTFF